MEGVQKAMKKGFRTLLKYGLGIRSVYILFRRLRSVLVEGIKEFANYDAETKANIDGLKASLQGLKGSFVALAAPIFNAVAPALQSLIDWVTKAIDAVSAFIAILGGKSTYKRAVTGISSTAGAISDAAGAAKELDRYMSGLDEMQKWQSDSSSGGGGSGGSSGGSSGGLAWEDVPIDMESNIAQFAMRVQDIFFDWSDLTYEQIAEKAVTALSMISGAIIGGTIGGVPGAIIGLVAGATLGVLASETLFDHDGVLSKDEVATLILPAIGAIVGGAIGFKAGGLKGALLGATIGFSATLALETLIFQKDENGNTFWSGYNSPVDYFVSEVLGWPSDQEIETGFNNKKTLFLLKWDNFKKELRDTFKEGGWLDDAWEELKTSLDEGWDTFISPIAGWIDKLKLSFANGVNSLIDIWNGFMDKLSSADLSVTIFGKEFDLNNVINFDNWKLDPIEVDVTANLKDTKDSIPDAKKIIPAMRASLADWKKADTFNSTITGLKSEFNKKGYASNYEKVIPGMKSEFNKKGYADNYDKTVTGMTSEFEHTHLSGKFSKTINGMTSEFARKSYSANYSKVIPSMTSEFSKKTLASGFNKNITGMNAELKTKGYANSFNFNISKMVALITSYKWDKSLGKPYANANAIFNAVNGSMKSSYIQKYLPAKPWAYASAYFNAVNGSMSSSYINKYLPSKPWAYASAYFNAINGSTSSGYIQKYLKSKPWAYASAYFNIAYAKVNGSWTQVAAGGGVFAGGKWNDVTSYASGGFPTGGQMFIAREAGPELVGTLKGHTAVVNNDQIVASVAAGVAKAIAGIEFHMEGLPTYQPVTPDKYPSIAQGGVIPPKILEAIDKLSEIKAAIDNLSAKLSNSGGNNSYQFTAQLDRRTLFDELIEEAQMRRNQSGLNPFMAV